MQRKVDIEVKTHICRYGCSWWRRVWLWSQSSLSLPGYRENSARPIHIIQLPSKCFCDTMHGVTRPLGSTVILLHRHLSQKVVAYITCHWQMVGGKWSWLNIFKKYFSLHKITCLRAGKALVHLVYIKSKARWDDWPQVLRYHTMKVEFLQEKKTEHCC